MAFFFEHNRPGQPLLDTSNSPINIPSLQPASKTQRMTSNESLRRQYRRHELKERRGMSRPRDTMDGASDSVEPSCSGTSLNSTPASSSLLRFSEVPTPEIASQNALGTTNAGSIVAPSSKLSGTAALSNSASVKEETPINKPLPAKPVQDGRDEPETRSIIDATDANMKSVTFASLTPKSSRDVVSRSSHRSLTPSNGYGGGSPTPRMMARKSSRSDLRGTRAPSQQGQRRVSSLPTNSTPGASLGQSSHFRRQSINSGKMSPEGTAVHKTVTRAASFISNDAPSPGLEPDDQVRRFTRYGVGVTMKVSLEANRAIYGQSPDAIRQATANTRIEQNTQREIILRLNTPDSDATPRLTRKPKPQGKKAPGQSDVAKFPPRISSLGATDADEGKQKHKRVTSFGSRLARPTAASAVREIEAKRKISEAKAAELLGLAEKSGTLTSVKKAGAGFRSRFTSFLPGRLRSDSNPSIEQKVQNADPVLHEYLSSGRLAAVQEPRASSRNLTRSNGTLTEPVRVRNNKRFSLESIGEVPKTSRERSPTEATYTSHGVPRDETASPLNNFVRYQALDQEKHHDTNPSHSSGVSFPHSQEANDGGDCIDELVRDAEVHLRRILEIAQGIQDLGMRSHVSAIAEALGEAIQSTRDLRMASIAAAATNANLALVTKSLSAAAATAIANLGSH